MREVVSIAVRSRHCPSADLFNAPFSVKGGSLVFFPAFNGSCVTQHSKNMIDAIMKVRHWTLRYPGDQT